MLVLRLLVLLLVGFPLFGDEQDRFICNTIQPGCSNVCFDVFAPVSVFRLWLFHLLLLALPHVIFATYVAHKVLSSPTSGGSYYDRSRGGSPFSLENLSLSRELSLHKAPLQDLMRQHGAPRFYCACLQVVILRILLEVVFGAGQFIFFGFSVPRSFLCYEAPCTSGVECYISRPTEKTLMLCFMLGVASSSILLSLLDLASTMKAMVVWRRTREMLVEEMSKGEQSSVFTTTTAAEDGDVLLRDEKHAPVPLLPNGEAPHAKVNPGALIKAGEPHKRPESRESKMEVPPTPMSTPVPTHFVLHSHLRPPLSPRPERGLPPNARVLTPMGAKKPSHHTSAGENSGQQSDSSDSQDKKAWV